MKVEATTATNNNGGGGQGVMLGLTPRYNGEEGGLSPWKYWSKNLYRKPRPRMTPPSSSSSCD
jgi:hypothetical protein